MLARSVLLAILPLLLPLLADGMRKRNKGSPELEVDRPRYYKLGYGATSCPTGTGIESSEECELAVGHLKNPELHVILHPDFPAQCAVRKDEDGLSNPRAYFNTVLGSHWGASVGKSRLDMAPICKRDGLGYYKLGYGAASCPTGTGIESSEECELAVEHLKNPELQVILHPDFPVQCAVRKDEDGLSNPRAYFNTVLGSHSGASVGQSRLDMAPICRRDGPRMR